MMYIIVVVLAIGIGIAINASTVIFCNRNEPKYIAMSVEFAFSFSGLMTSTVPMLLKEAHPVPFFSVCNYCLLGMVVLCCLDTKKKGGKKIGS